MARVKSTLKSVGTQLKISKVFINKNNGQMTIVLPKRKMKSIPIKVQVTYW